MEALEHFQESVSVRGVRWTALQNLHVTVFFFGDVEERNIPSLKMALSGLCRSTPVFTLDFEGVTFAPPPRSAGGVSPGRPPRMIWVQFARSEEFGRFAAHVFEVAKPFLDLKSVRRLEHDPIPHVTLARFDDPAVAAQIHLEQLQPETVPVDTAILFASELRRDGSVYTSLERYALSPAA